MNRMNSKPKVDGTRFQLLGQSTLRVKKRSTPSIQKWAKVLRPSQRHDPMLVLNMASFNFSDGWNRMFNPMKVHQNGIP
jgi:hypothetical protein